MEIRPVNELLEKVAQELQQHCATAHKTSPLMVGIHTGGVWIATYLHRQMELHDPLGSLDISFYRDDFTQVGLNPQVKPSRLPLDVDKRHVILVDDVLFTGRTIRAAMNELFDYGRPASITLVALLERAGRELPIRPDVVGQSITLPAKKQVKLTGPSPLQWVVETVSHAT